MIEQNLSPQTDLKKLRFITYGLVALFSLSSLISGIYSLLVSGIEMSVVGPFLTSFLPTVLPFLGLGLLAALLITGLYLYRQFGEKIFLQKEAIPFIFSIVLILISSILFFISSVLPIICVSVLAVACMVAAMSILTIFKYLNYQQLRKSWSIGIFVFIAVVMMMYLASPALFYLLLSGIGPEVVVISTFTVGCFFSLIAGFFIFKVVDYKEISYWTVLIFLLIAISPFLLFIPVIANSILNTSVIFVSLFVLSFILLSGSMSRFTPPEVRDFLVPMPQGELKLCYAAQEGRLEVIEYLIKAGADITDVNDQKETALICAIKANHVEVVKYLLELQLKLQPSESITIWENLLIAAASSGSLRTIEFFLGIKNSRNLNASVNPALLVAAETGCLDVVKVLLPHVVDLPVNDKGDSLLHCAAKSRFLDVVKFVINEMSISNSNINLKNNEGDTALACAVKANNLGVIRYLLSDSKFGLNINESNNQGDTALILASQMNSFSVVNFLLEKGAMVCQKNNLKQDALFYAIQNGNLDIVKSLIKVAEAINYKEAFLQALKSENSDKVKIVEYLLTEARKAGQEITVDLSVAETDSPDMARALIKEGRFKIPDDEEKFAPQIKTLIGKAVFGGYCEYSLVSTFIKNNGVPVKCFNTTSFSLNKNKKLQHLYDSYYVKKHTLKYTENSEQIKDSMIGVKGVDALELEIDKSITDIMTNYVELGGDAEEKSISTIISIQNVALLSPLSLYVQNLSTSPVDTSYIPAEELLSRINLLNPCNMLTINMFVWGWIAKNSDFKNLDQAFKEIINNIVDKTEPIKKKILKLMHFTQNKYNEIRFFPLEGRQLDGSNARPLPLESKNDSPYS